MVLELGSHPKPTQIAKALVGVPKTRSDLDTNRVARSAQKIAKNGQFWDDMLPVEGARTQQTYGLARL